MDEGGGRMKYLIEIRTDPETWTTSMFAAIKKQAIDAKKKSQEALAKEETNKLLKRLKSQPVSKI